MIDLESAVTLGGVVLKPGRQTLKIKYKDLSTVPDPQPEDIEERARDVQEETVTGRLIDCKSSYVTLDVSAQYYSRTLDLYRGNTQFLSIEVIEEVPF